MNINEAIEIIVKATSKWHPCDKKSKAVEFLKDLQEQERIEVLPADFIELCKLQGDYVYYLFGGEIIECTLCSIGFDNGGTLSMIIAGEDDRWDIPISAYNKTMFLTQEAAELTLTDK